MGGGEFALDLGSGCVSSSSASSYFFLLIFLLFPLGGGFSIKIRQVQTLSFVCHLPNFRGVGIAFLVPVSIADNAAPRRFEAGCEKR